MIISLWTSGGLGLFCGTASSKGMISVSPSVIKNEEVGIGISAI